ncbi:MAG TPA: thymidylate kinase [Planctomycetaceae bacterium]|jgi:dTMP kinase
MLIDLEGIDGSGKGTQARRLCDRFTQSGVSAALVSFPRYEATLFGRAVGDFLNGRFGSLNQVHPFLVSLLFAGDRFESKQYLLEAIARHEVVVLDRYVPSNVAHQASKLDGALRTELAARILDIEFDIFGLPRPDLVLLLDLPVSMAQQLIAKKSARQYTDRKADIQEADANYLGRVREVYHELAAAEPNWQVIACCDSERLRTVDEIHQLIWSVAVHGATRTRP